MLVQELDRNGSSVSGKGSFRATVLPCDDHTSLDQNTTSGPAPSLSFTSSSVAPPPFSALYYSPEESPDHIKPAVAEPDSCPPPPFVPVQSTNPTPPTLSISKNNPHGDTKAESSGQSAEEKEPPPPYSEGPSPLGSFTYMMAAAGGPASIITQVSPGGPSPPREGNAFSEFVLLSLFPNGLLPDGHMTSFHEGDTYPVDYDPASLQYMLDFFRTVAQTIPSSSSSPTTDTPSTETNIPGSARDMLHDRAGIIVLREDLDFYAIPHKADIDQSEMIEVKRAAGRALLKQDGIFSGLRKSEEAGTTEQHLIEMLTAGGFYNDDRWGHRASEPNKAVICSLALARLRTDIKGNDLANSNAVGMAQKLLLFWRKPARRCWWEGVELDDVEGVEGFALYRALQRRSRKVFPNEQADSFEKHVKNAFRINAKARSRASICAALNTGYAALEDLAAGKLNILRQLKELAKSPRLGSSRTTKTRKVPVQATQAKRNRPRQQPHDTGRRWPHPDAKPVLDGLPSPPPGRLRRIPTLINANHIPFLRFRKPQSPFLSYVIRKKNDEREKRVDRLQALERCLLFADDEDEWDRILRKDHREHDEEVTDSTTNVRYPT
ncbi:MAG: hypothetical protein L6R41_002006 [Letrouitia leprolyta]|nr:MAG: hypothetical protein L6R41_002006 [Letrouitia leprolyta]